MILAMRSSRASGLLQDCPTESLNADEMSRIDNFCDRAGLSLLESSLDDHS